MSEGFVPANERFLSHDEINNPDVELIFVQHGPEITTKQATEAYLKFLDNSTAQNITITQLPGQTPVYPISFGDGQLHVSRKVDQYLIATPST